MRIDIESLWDLVMDCELQKPPSHPKNRCHAGACVYLTMSYVWYCWDFAIIKIIASLLDSAKSSSNSKFSMPLLLNSLHLTPFQTPTELADAESRGFY